MSTKQKDRTISGKVLVTGAAGFIGYHLSKRLLSEGFKVVGVDNLNSYYSVDLKKDRLENLLSDPKFEFKKADLADYTSLDKIFSDNELARVYNLAAQAGVRYSLTHPEEYIQSNIQGFANLLECCRKYPVSHLIFASSSSVYGLNLKQPYSVSDVVDHPVSLYAATKKSNELMAHVYSHLFGVPTTGLRFFTVYGPWGRPDMAYYKFVQKILAREQIEVYNHGDMARDFTYIDDIVEALYRLMSKAPNPNSCWDAETPDPATSSAPYRIYNIGNNAPVSLMDFVETIQKELGCSADIKLMPMQPGDVQRTWADSTELYKAIDYLPGTSLDTGIMHFVDWYKSYHKILENVNQ
ncbi:NAD-dependent epimerase [Fodinibius sp. AD559]|uniref:NAD-dependent epimerase n=1 Tax=Fodinibius sp. AD559 TaxID=3424179 RepID=UPI0040469B44